MEDLTPSTIESVGWVVKETKQSVTLVAHLTDSDNASGELCILKNVIIKRKNLEH